MMERKKDRGERGTGGSWEKKRDRGDDREKERSGSQEAERTSLHSLTIRAVIGQQHDTCAGKHEHCDVDCATLRGIFGKKQTLTPTQDRLSSESLPNFLTEQLCFHLSSPLLSMYRI